jgi:hypothetical protein
MAIRPGAEVETNLVPDGRRHGLPPDQVPFGPEWGCAGAVLPAGHEELAGLVVAQYPGLVWNEVASRPPRLLQGVSTEVRRPAPSVHYRERSTSRPPIRDDPSASTRDSRSAREWPQVWVTRDGGSRSTTAHQPGSALGPSREGLAQVTYGLSRPQRAMSGRG